MFASNQYFKKRATRQPALAPHAHPIYKASNSNKKTHSKKQEKREPLRGAEYPEVQVETMEDQPRES